MDAATVGTRGMSVCAAPGTGGAFLAEMLAHLDCQAQTMGASGYQALAAVNSPVALALGALLTIFIALYGIRLLLGTVPTLSDTVIAFVKVGIVLTLASSWVAYRVIAYDVVLKAPAEIFSSIGSATGLPGADGGLAARLQGVDNGIVALTVAGSGRLDLSNLPQTGSVATNSAPMVVADGFALGTARVAYLGSTIAGLGLVRLSGGFLLALAPLFAGFLLFEGTRFLFMGWLRMLISIALGSLALTIVLSVETSVLEPWLANVLAQRAASIATIAAPVELLVIALAFAIVLLGMIAIAMRVAWANIVPAIWNSVPSRDDARVDGQNPERNLRLQDQLQILASSRPQLIANAIDRTQRRDEGVGGWRSLSLSDRTSVDVNEPSSVQKKAGATPLGQSYQRNARRVSASGTARSARA
jgi:type IV secretion system protein VirB6